MAGKLKRPRRRKRDETWNCLDKRSRSPERDRTTFPFSIDKAELWVIAVLIFLQGGVAMFFYVMTICTPVMVLILLAGKRQSKCGSTQVM